MKNSVPVNPGLRHVDGLRNLKSARIAIRNNVDLEGVDGLCNLRDAKQIYLDNDPKLKSVEGLSRNAGREPAHQSHNRPIFRWFQLKCGR